MDVVAPKRADIVVTCIKWLTHDEENPGKHLRAKSYFKLKL